MALCITKGKLSAYRRKKRSKYRRAKLRKARAKAKILRAFQRTRAKTRGVLRLRLRCPLLNKRLRDFFF